MTQTAAPPETPQTLDELMIAMDVVDTLRHREDVFLDETGQRDHARYRLTLIGDSHERDFPSEVVLSRSRYLAPANHSLRFYREYFQPESEREVEKDRRRWLVRFRETDFYVNVDRLDKPDLGSFVEIKSRTWSRRDAESKSELILQLARVLGPSSCQ